MTTQEMNVRDNLVAATELSSVNGPCVPAIVHRSFGPTHNQL